jgi:hypothetical protein
MDFSTIIKSFARIREYCRQRSAPLDGAQRVGLKNISLAFACVGLAGRLKSNHIEIATQWAAEQLLYSKSSTIAKKRFRKAVKSSAGFFNRHSEFDPAPVCGQIAAVLPVSDRYEVIGLCIRISNSNRTLCGEQVNLLKACSKWLGLDADRFRLMVEKRLPLDVDPGESDIELLFGIAPDMSGEQVQDILTEEFRKWNARITNQNPEIRDRADKMIRIITAHRVACQI